MSACPDLSKYEVILLDVNGTFMFGQDRFDNDDALAATFQTLGGGLEHDDAVAAIRKVIDYMLPRYRDPAFHSDFPNLYEAMAISLADLEFDQNISDRLAKTFMVHEVGHVPDCFAAALKELRQAHRLGVISDIWSPKDIFLDVFREAGIINLFDHMIFSSDSLHVKPSSALFLEALGLFGCNQKNAIYVGDNLMRDVGGAAGVGMDSIWLTNGKNATPLLSKIDVTPTYVVENLTVLAT
jgi:FMN phosphatase YigB (HAD superfamily)